MNGNLGILFCVIAGPWLIKKGIDAIRSGKSGNIALDAGQVRRNERGVEDTLQSVFYWQSMVIYFVVGGMLIIVVLVEIYRFLFSS